MANLARTGLSLDRELLAKFDDSIAEKRYENRSEAIRDLIRGSLIAKEVDKNAMVAATLTIVYDTIGPN